jgi:hypothetical protein
MLFAGMLMVFAGASGENGEGSSEKSGATIPVTDCVGYENYIYQTEYVRKWDQLVREGKLTGAQVQLAARTKPVQGLYDSETDPHMVNNLADDPKHTAVLNRMRKQLYEWMIETRDLGLLDEPEMLARAGDRSPWEVGQELENYKRILSTADLHRTGDLNELLARVSDPDSAVRFWAITGLVILANDSEEVRDALKQAINDPSVSVRIAAADGLLRLGAAVCDLTENDGTLRLTFSHYYPIPGAQNQFHIVCDEQSRLFWMTSNQVTGMAQDAYRGWGKERRFLMLHYSRDAQNWFPAGVLAMWPRETQAFNYCTPVIDGDDLLFVS